MRIVVLALLALAACGRDAEPPPPPPSPPPAPPEKIPVPAPPAERRIAFVRRSNVWVMNPDGSGARAVTSLKDAAAGSPAWSPDRRRIAFIAAIDPEFQITPRNLFVIGADGSDLRQVTPIPRADRRLDDAPKGVARGRALRIVKDVREPVAGLRVTTYGTHREAQTGPDGTFQIYLPAGGGWVKVAGVAYGRHWSATRFAGAREGAAVELGDIVLSSGGDGEPASPAWSADGRHLAYLFRHSLLDRTEQGGTVSLRSIGVDGSGDQTIAMPAPASIVAGPILQGGVAWIKTSDGRLFRIDLDTRRISAVIDVGTGVPDALALAPDGATFATLRIEEAGMLSIALVRNGAAQTLATLKPDDSVPHSLDFSPNGATIVLDRRTGTSSDLWSFEIATRRWTRLTSDGESSDPVWNGR